MSLNSYIKSEFGTSGLWFGPGAYELVTIAVLKHHMDDFNEGMEISRHDPLRGKIIAKFSQNDIKEILEKIGPSWRKIFHYSFLDIGSYNAFVSAVDRVIGARL